MSGLEEIGRRLREARERKGLSLAAAEEGTKIRRKYLEALEAGRREDLPQEVYIRGYIRTYGNFLGLDGQRLLQEYRQAEGETAGAPPPAAGAAPRVRVRPGARHGRRRQREGGRGLWLALALVVAAGVALAWLAFAPAGRPADAPPVTTQPVTEPPPPPPPPVQAPQPQPEPAPPPSPQVVRGQPEGNAVPVTVTPGPIQLRLSIRPPQAWVSVQVDGKVVLAGTFPGGTVREFTAQERLVLDVGYVDVVDVTINGQTFAPVLQEPYHRLVVTVRR